MTGIDGSDENRPDLRVLSLSGGGFLGLYSAHILAALEERVGRPIGSCFDLIAGTSIGGIIALGLAHEVPAQEIVAALEHHGPMIFSSRPAPQGRFEIIRDLFRFALKPKYKAEHLKIAITETLGTKTLAEAKHAVIVPALNMTKGKPQVFKTPHDPRYEHDWKLASAEIALAASSAPTLFAIAELEDQLFVDGGLYANSPDLIAYHEATYYMHASPESLYMLSIGTTTGRYSLSQQTGRQFGASQWMLDSRLLSAIFGSQQQVAEFVMSHLLGDHYVRLDCTQAREQERYLKMDVASEAAIKDIRGLANATVQERLGSKQVAQFLDYTAPAPKFYYVDAN
jgi:patatin-like phospholipase/acyl hydrolase